MESNSGHNRRRNHRLTVDLDTRNRLKLFQAYFNAKHLFPEARIQTFTTGKGYHLRVFQPNLTVEENLAVRRCLGDDYGKLRFDELRLRAKKVWVLGKDGIWRLEVDEGLIDWTDTAFQHKYRNGKWTHEEEYNVLTEPFFSKMPARKT